VVNSPHEFCVGAIRDNNAPHGFSARSKTLP
jgi:hypothetical protein